MKNQKGITILVLVITIAVLMILIGISVSTVVGNRGAISSGEYTKFATEIEELQLKIRMKLKYSNNYTNTIDNLLGEGNNYNDKLTIQNSELKYIYENTTEEEREWLNELGIDRAE